MRQLSFLSRVSRAATLPERFHRQRNSTSQTPGKVHRGRSLALGQDIMPRDDPIRPRALFPQPSVDAPKTILHIAGLHEAGLLGSEALRWPALSPHGNRFRSARQGRRHSSGRRGKRREWRVGASRNCQARSGQLFRSDFHRCVRKVLIRGRAGNLGNHCGQCQGLSSGAAAVGCCKRDRAAELDSRTIDDPSTSRRHSSTHSHAARRNTSQRHAAEPRRSAGYAGADAR